MEQKQTSFEEQLQFGEEGEELIAAIFIKKGFAVLPLYQFTAEFAPKIITLQTNFISPDLTIFKNGKVVFIEVKSKTRWVKFNGVVETGCNFRHYEHYKNLSEYTNIDLYLVFNHTEDKPEGIYTVSIQTEGRYWDGIVKNKQINPPMFFWNYKNLKPFV